MADILHQSYIDHTQVYSVVVSMLVNSIFNSKLLRMEFFMGKTKKKQQQQQKKKHEKSKGDFPNRL